MLFAWIWMTLSAWPAAERCAVELDPATVRPVTTLLRRLQDVAPTLSAEELAAHDDLVARFAAEEGLSLTAAGFETLLRERFEYRIAAIEYAGFETLKIPNDTPDRARWTRDELRDGLTSLGRRKGGRPYPRIFLTQWRTIGARLSEFYGEPVSTYSFWRAARRTYGSFSDLAMLNDANESGRSSVAADARDKLRLRPGTAAARRRIQAGHLRVLAAAEWGRSRPAVIRALARFLYLYGEFNDRSVLWFFLTRECPDMGWFAGFENVFARLTAEDPGQDLRRPRALESIF